MSDMWLLSDDEVEKRERKIADADLSLFISLGLFFRSFGAVEHQLDRNLCHVIGMRDFEVYEIAVTGTLPQNKVKKFRQVLKNFKVKLSDNIESRLDYFRDDICKMRNRFAHNYVVENSGLIIVGSPGKMPDAEPNPHRPQRLTPPSYTFTAVRRASLWLNDFWYDLDEIANETWRDPLPQEITIASFRSTLPPKK